MAYHHYHHHHFNPSHPAHPANPIHRVHHHRSQKTYTEVDSTATTVPTNDGEVNRGGVIALVLLFAIVIMCLFAHDSH